MRALLLALVVAVPIAQAPLRVGGQPCAGAMAAMQAAPSPPPYKVTGKPCPGGLYRLSDGGCLLTPESWGGKATDDPCPAFAPGCPGFDTLQIRRAQEKQTPDGEWCQRPTQKMSPKAHACACHTHNCKADPTDLNNLSAHTDNKCLNFCTVTKCECLEGDCP
jgi:hypothetical protein